MIYLSENAHDKVQQLRHDQNRPHAALRVAVLGGDCAGLKYFIGLDEFRSADDLAVRCGDVDIFTDSTSAPYLWGAEIEWIEVEDDAGFVVLNPNKGRSRGGCSQQEEGQGCMTLGDGKHCVKPNKCKSCVDSSKEPISISLLD
ncbi:MAG: iron-sulfur cluster assembly accessory protein [bacterium]|nr:iron-sulfur cluster assembly accessory protein [bacterium]